MFAWFARLIGWAPAAAPAASGRAAAGASAATPVSFGLRRPLVGRSGAVAGFELLLPPGVQRRVDAAGDTPAATAHRVALLAAAAPLAAAGRSPLVAVPARAFERQAVCDAAGPGVLLLVDDLAAVPPAALADMRRRGVGLGVSDRPPDRALPVDFVVLQASSGGLDTLLLSAQRWREVWPRLTIIALGLEHLDDVERALRSGVNLAGGQLSRGTAPPPRRELGSAAHRICELLNHLALDRDTGTIAEAVRGDVALTYRLLRYANSPAIGLRRAVETVDDAVILLGRAELYRWLSVQLMTAAQGRQASRALQESALARGRLLETLGQRRADPNANAGTLFTLGMLSMIELLMQMPMQQALQPLRLSEPVRDALLQRQGPLADYLRLLEAIEAGNAAQAEACMRALGVDDSADGLVERAWAWAAAAMV